MYALFQVIQLFIRLLIYTFIGKGLLTLLAGPAYRDNAIWRIFDAVTRPVWKLTRAIAPRIIPDTGISMLAVLILIAVNIGLYMIFYSQGWITPLRGNPAG